jgi:hypothetical protein
MAQVAEHLPSKHKALSSNPNTKRIKNKTKQKNQHHKKKKEKRKLCSIKEVP